MLRESDTIGRLGGDEFVVLVEGGANQIAERILEVLREPFDLGSGTGQQISITTSIGIASGDREAAKDLLRDADIALYEAKGAGRNRYVEFRHEMHIAAHDRLELENDLRGAIARQELFLVYQPILDLDDRPRSSPSRRCCAGSTPRAGSSRRRSSSRSPRTAG